jgi:hypothetical protein
MVKAGPDGRPAYRERDSDLHPLLEEEVGALLSQTTVTVWHNRLYSVVRAEPRAERQPKTK